MSCCGHIETLGSRCGTRIRAGVATLLGIAALSTASLSIANETKQAAVTRIITLTPHATELVHAAGGGDKLIATVESSNYPPQMLALPRVGDGLRTSLEQLVGLAPDLVIGWPSPLMDRVARTGVPVFKSNPASLEDIAKEVDALGERLGTVAIARANSEHLRKRAAALPDRKEEETISVVVMAGEGFVIGRDALLNSVLERCGGHNPFGEHAAAAPKVTREGMISVAPALTVTGQMPANPNTIQGEILVLDPDILFRPGPRFVEAAEAICAGIERIAKRKDSQHHD